MTIASPTKIMNPTLQRVLRDQEEILLNQKVLALERGIRVSLDLTRWVLMDSRTPPNRKVREGRVSSELLTRRPAGVNATKSEGISDARTIVSGQADCPDTIGANVVAMATMNAAAERGKKPERQSLRRGLREPSCRRPRGARLSGTQTLLGNLNVSKSLRLIIVIG
jgi:hypothetical protein